MRKRILPSRNILLRLALYLFLMNIVILVVSTMFVYQYTANSIKNNTAYYAKDYVRSMNNELNMYLKEIDFMTMSLFFLEEDMFTLLNDPLKRIEMRAYFDSFKYSRDFINDIFLINKYGEVGGTSSAYKDRLLVSDIYQIIEQSDGELVVSPMGYPEFVMNTEKAEEEVLFLGRKIKSPQTNSIEGVVIVTVYADRIYQIIDKQDKQYDEMILLLDRNARLINPVASPQQEVIDRLTGMSFQDNTERLIEDGYLYLSVAEEEGALSPLQIVGLIPEPALLKEAASLRNQLALIVVVLLLISMTLSLGLAYNFVKPILQLALYMKKMNQDQLAPYKSREMKDEIGFLIRSFNQMVSRLQASFDHIEQERDKQKKAELRALQAQINPHFIYNTLNNVRWLVKVGRTEPVFEMITSMNEVLVGAFRLDDPIISIAEEIGYLQQYVKIQAMAHPDQFEVIYDLDDNVKEGEIARMSLQPIMENAILHGILPKRKKGTIRVRGREAEDHLIIEVEDNGVGSVSHPVPRPGRERVGIINVDKRIQLYFGADYGVRWKSEPGVGTIVKVILPKSKRRSQ
ncbi:sensor histidine kinase [Paenibacillus senegalensis]|uniref:sensor histidine kinase n=1 Tax=Paenibacillus senegalensis TaxID=1465766 RepID=UPI00028806B4|nr:sensor histidine kinase [Paenibacillus senegalensis]